MILLLVIFLLACVGFLSIAADPFIAAGVALAFFAGYGFAMVTRAVDRQRGG